MSPRVNEASETLPIVVAVYRKGAPLYVVDAAGRAFATGTDADRVETAMLLAHAAGALAAQPPAEPILTPSVLTRILDALSVIGTPEAEAAHTALGDAVEIHASALEMATAVLRDADPIQH